MYPPQNEDKSQYEINRFISQQEALEYLKEKGIFKDFQRCPFCNCSNIAKIRRNKLLCRVCRKEWSFKKYSIFENCKIPLNKLLKIVKLFEFEIPAFRAAKEVKLSYPTVLRVYNLLKSLIVKNSKDYKKLK